MTRKNSAQSRPLRLALRNGAAEVRKYQAVNIATGVLVATLFVGTIVMIPRVAEANQRISNDCSTLLTREHEYPLIDPCIYQIEHPTVYRDQNGKKSRVYNSNTGTPAKWYFPGYDMDAPHGQISYHGQHIYTCGVKGSYSTYAHYDFGKIGRDGNYEIYAYWPGFSESVENRNNGNGNFAVYVNGDTLRRWEERSQYGGWERVEFGNFGWGKYHGRSARQKRALDKGDRLQITIHNGNNSREGECSPGTRVVFPPLLLMRIEDYPNHKPFSPAHDIWPRAALDFAECLKNTNAQLNRPSSAELWLLVAETVAKLVFGYFGEEAPLAFTALGHIESVDRWSRTITLCDQFMLDRLMEPNCEPYRIGLAQQWSVPASYPNTSVDSVYQVATTDAQIHQLVFWPSSRVGIYPAWLNCGGVRINTRSENSGGNPDRLRLMPRLLEADARANNGLR